MCIQHLADTYFKTNKSFARQTLDTFTYNNEKIFFFMLYYKYIHQQWQRVTRKYLNFK